MKYPFNAQKKLARRILCLSLCMLFVSSLLPPVALGANSTSEYKHISHEGAPYNLDAITGATLTVEGPGVEMSIPITVRQLQEASDSIIHQGTYTDGRGRRMYEGVRLLSLLDGFVNENVSTLDDNVEVVFKNRWRQDIGRLTYGEIKAADNSGSPVLLAYGTANADGSNVRPLVFIGGAGEDTSLGNGDGPIRLTYNQAMSGSLPNSGYFPSVAYLYVEEHAGRPGYRHTSAADPAYNNPVNTEYLITLTGDALGREITFSVAELQEMVEYDLLLDRPSENGLGHRDEYSLSNTTYWYVNEYEGIKLWDLLLKTGLPESKSTDDETLVSFSSWDNYRINTQFSLQQLANPDLFYFYEKSPLDIGTDRPTRAQLATDEFMPDNQGDGWTVDANGYPVRQGYPVLLAYGLNGYPYVRDSSLPGYRTGLGNDGGPLRLIYGKTDGLNRSNPRAQENYAYFYNNGSQQLQRVQEIYVGNEVRYSTHMDNPNPAYQAMANEAALTVDIVSAGVTTTHAFTLAELEGMIYGVDKRTRDGDGRQEKGYYVHSSQLSGSNEQNLFEGVNLEFLLADHIGLQGTLGTVELYGENSSLPDAVLDLATIGSRGFNSMSGSGDLGMMIAFAKNSYPLVRDIGSQGYVSTDSHITSRTIMNSGGPLMFIRGQTAEERDANRVTTVGEAKSSVLNLARIVVNLEPDVFAHTGQEHAENAAHEITFKGAVTHGAAGIAMSVGILETMQRYMITGEYEVDGASKTYRGLDLLRLLNSSAIGASGLMDEVLVTGADGSSTVMLLEFLFEASERGKPVILAYGSSAGGHPDYLGAEPLTLPFGPMRLIIDGANSTDCISSIVEVEVIASELFGWKHNTGVYAQYSNVMLEISGQNLARNRSFSVADIEEMENIMVFDTYLVGSYSFWSQGVELYKLLSSIGFADGIESSEFTATASDGYSMQFTASQLQNGVNGKPIIIAFGQGTTQSNGLPLVTSDSDPGYSAAALNDGGPLRLMVHDNSGWSVKFLTSIVVGAAGGISERTDFVRSVFTAYAGGGAEGFPEAGVRSISVDGSGNVVVGTYGGGIAQLLKEKNEFEVVSTSSEPMLLSPFTSGVAIDDSGGIWFTQNTSYTDLSQNHGVGFIAPNGDVTYYNTDETPGTIPDNYVQAIEIDDMGNVWFGSVGGLTRYMPSSGEWRTWTKDDGLPAESVNTIVFDSVGGVWIGCYPDAIGTVTLADVGSVDAYAGGYAYIDESGEIVFSKVYDYRESPDLIPWLMADFWVRGISVDSNGGAWVVRSSSFMPHVGGRVDYVNPDRSSVISWTGHELLGSSTLTGTQEIRDVAVDVNGGLWFGTSGAGLFHCTAPGAVSGVYSIDTRAWPSGTALDNIYVVKFVDEMLYIGSAGGLAFTEASLMPGIAAKDEMLLAVSDFVANDDGSSVSRNEFVRLLSNLTTGVSEDSGGSTGFSDVSGISEPLSYISWAVSLGVVRGYPDNSFRADAAISREELAVMLDRFIRAMHFDFPQTGESSGFSDIALVSSFAAPSVEALQRFGVLDAGASGAFNPEGEVSRFEVSDAISAYIESFVAK